MTREGLAAAVVVLGSVVVVGQGPTPQPAPETAAAALTDCETATADVLLLRARVVQLEQQLVSSQLEAERVRLEASFRARLQPPAGYVFDWASKTFKPPPAPAQP